MYTLGFLIFFFVHYIKSYKTLIHIVLIFFLRDDDGDDISTLYYMYVVGVMSYAILITYTSE